jgi:hypothetical protein
MAKWFVLSVGIIFAVTGAAKIWSGFGSAHLLLIIDPLVGITFHHLMLVAGAFELVVAGVCFICKSQTLLFILISWLATCIAMYRAALWWIGWHTPCKCLGNLTDALHILPQTADTIMKIILAYLLIGGYAVLFQRWRKARCLQVKLEV